MGVAERAEPSEDCVEGQPGVDPGVIQMAYSGDVRSALASSGDLVFKTHFGPLTDHAPVSFDAEGQTISTSFVKKGNTVGFNIGSYDGSKPITIDPWVVFPPSPNSNKVWEVETDAVGNVYTYSGDMPFTLRKYNSSGVLQWTYLTSWDSSGYWVGGMKIGRAHV